MDELKTGQCGISGANQVTVEVVAWVTRFVGGDGTRRRHFGQTVPPGATVRSVLQQVAQQFPQLEEALWDQGGRDLAEHIEVLVNDTVLGVTHSLDSGVKNGDRITLVGAYMGGSGGSMDSNPKIGNHQDTKAPRRIEHSRDSTPNP